MQNCNVERRKLVAILPRKAWSDLSGIIFSTISYETHLIWDTVIFISMQLNFSHSSVYSISSQSIRYAYIHINFYLMYSKWFQIMTRHLKKKHFHKTKSLNWLNFKLGSSALHLGFTFVFTLIFCHYKGEQFHSVFHTNPPGRQHFKVWRIEPAAILPCKGLSWVKRKSPPTWGITANQYRSTFGFAPISVPLP